jgi:hypothetical protein
MESGFCFGGFYEKIIRQKRKRQLELNNVLSSSITSQKG